MNLGSAAVAAAVPTLARFGGGAHETAQSLRCNHALAAAVSLSRC